MNSNRRAELQRKLSMTTVPRPPAGLAQRIKEDIPAYLQAEPERERFSRSIAFSMRIAASILLLITTAFMTLYLVQPDAPQMTMARDTAVQLQPAVTRSLGQPHQSTAGNAAVQGEEIRLEMSEQLPGAPGAAKIAPPAGAGGALASRADERRREKKEADIAPPPMQIAEAMPAETAYMEPAREPVTERITVTADAPMLADAAAGAPAAPAMAPAPAIAPPPPPPAAEGERSRAAARPMSFGLTKEAIADGLDLDAKNPFGITTDPMVFYRIRSALENGQKPASSAVNVEALVNYFAGEPERRPRIGVRLEVEASPAPVDADGENAVLRLTIDTPGAKGSDEGLPVARDASVEISINDDAVSRFYRIGNDHQISAEDVLLHDVSVTALYHLELRPGLRGSQYVATVRLKYRSVTDGELETITKIVRGRDLAKSWVRSSRRHRLASLGAVWGESLKGVDQGIDVAKRAGELVTQDPKDPLARELAVAASATGGK